MDRVVQGSENGFEVVANESIRGYQMLMQVLLVFSKLSFSKESLVDQYLIHKFEMLINAMFENKTRSMKNGRTKAKKFIQRECCRVIPKSYFIAIKINDGMIFFDARSDFGLSPVLSHPIARFVLYFFLHKSTPKNLQGVPFDI